MDTESQNNGEVGEHYSERLSQKDVRLKYQLPPNIVIATGKNSEGSINIEPVAETARAMLAGFAGIRNTNLGFSESVRRLAESQLNVNSGLLTQALNFHRVSVAKQLGSILTGSLTHEMQGFRGMASAISDAQRVSTLASFTRTRDCFTDQLASIRCSFGASHPISIDSRLNILGLSREASSFSALSESIRKIGQSQFLANRDSVTRPLDIHKVAIANPLSSIFRESLANIHPNFGVMPRSLVGIPNAMERVRLSFRWSEVVPFHPTSEYGVRETQESNDPANETFLSVLGRLDPRLRHLWIGANLALESGNPDRIRHFMVSLRELLMHVLHMLAPDDELLKWSRIQEHLDRGRPTRKGRLLYIEEWRMKSGIGAFLTMNISDALEFLNQFQRGTHAVEPHFNMNDLRRVRLGAEQLIRFLVESRFPKN